MNGFEQSINGSHIIASLLVFSKRILVNSNWNYSHIVEPSQVLEISVDVCEICDDVQSIFYSLISLVLKLHSFPLAYELSIYLEIKNNYAILKAIKGKKRTFYYSL